MSSSPISKFILEGREFFVKHDELIDPYLSGNKFRKLYTLIQTPKEKIHKIISYGGTQSNAMLAIAALCKEKSWEFVYYSKTISPLVKAQRHGNYFEALELGMQSIEIEDELYRDYIAGLSLNVEEGTFFLDQGGANPAAQKGIEVLVQEIREQLQTKEFSEVKAVATPSGTGTTALYLALALPEFTIYTTPCVGDSAYLKVQMQALHTLPNNLVILEPRKKYHFAKLYKEFLATYKLLQKSGVEFDLLYAPAMWMALQEQTSTKVLYIHSGGLKGNVSMLERYKKRNFSL